MQLADEPGGVHSVWVGDTEHRARTVILAMGAEHKKLGIPGEEELSGRGVSYCATCDAAFFKDAHTIIVGGGDSAMEEAIFLSKFAAEGDGGASAQRVPRLEDHARARARAGQHRAAHALHVERFEPGENGALSVAKLLNTDTGERREISITGAFIAVGHEPQSSLVAGQIDLDENGYVRVDARSTRTNRPGVFAAGDLVDHTYRQAITAAGLWLSGRA